MSENFWDSPELTMGEYLKFEKPGDEHGGLVTDIRMTTFDDGTKAPQLVFDIDGEDKIMTCGAVRLKIALVEAKPAVGDHVRVKFTSEERRGNRTIRNWDVQVQRKADAAVAAPPAFPGQYVPAAPAEAPQAASVAPQAAPAQSTPDPAAVAAALANLTPEQKAALGL